MIPQCINVQEVIIHNSTKSYEDLPVSFQVNNRNMNGFLTHNQILKRTSDIISCEKAKDKNYYLKNSSLKI